MNDSSEQSEAAAVPPNLPPVVYLPCVEYVRDPADAAIELQRTVDDRLVIMAYSALDRLHAAYGEQKPWVVVQTAVLARYRQVQEFHRVVLDEGLPLQDSTS